MNIELHLMDLLSIEQEVAEYTTQCAWDVILD
jgi:hypothetical protein